MNHEKKIFNWKPLSEYNGGRVLATNGLDILIGEINSDGDCADGEGCLLCGITAFAGIEDIMPKPKKSKDERIRKHAITILEKYISYFEPRTPNSDTKKHLVNKAKECIAWLEKQSEEARNIALRTEYEKGRADVIAEVPELPKEVDSQIWQIADNSAKTWEQSFAILNATQKAYNKGREDALKEQKPVDKVEPKYHEGDWITNGDYTWKIVEVKPLHYILQSQDGNIVNDTISYVDECFHSFTIKDAKDGDVVVDKSDGTIGIFQSIGHHPDGGSYNDTSYCFLHCRYDDGFFYADFENGNMIDADDLSPATKKQRGLLFAKMKEAGYEWDAEKKELNKIEDEPEHPYCQEHCKGYKESGGKCYFGFDCPTKREAEQKHQEEDDVELTDFEADLFSAFSDGWQIYLHDKDGLDVAQWAKEHSSELLESAKRTLSKWSDEDTEILSMLIELVESKEESMEVKIELIDWLKSLKSQKQCSYNPYKATVESIAEMCKRYDVASHSGLRDFYANVKVKCKEAIEYDKKYPQKQWKPSDEQLAALDYVRRSYNPPATEKIAWDSLKSIEIMYWQLKKLTEE